MKPTRQDIIEDLQNRIWKNRIATLDDLRLEISCAEYDGNEPIDEYDDVLLPMEWNVCDRCGELWESERLYWESCDWEDTNNANLIRGIKGEQGDYTALCSKCVAELIKKGEEAKD